MPLHPRNFRPQRRDAQIYSQLHWYTLPYEIRIMVLGHLANHNVQNAERASWSSVCAEWRDFFETRAFACLTLKRVDDIRDFGRLGRHLRDKVKRVRLHVPLNRYDCTRCDEPEDTQETIANNMAFSGLLLALLNILASWQRREDGGLALEISAASPSDTQHYFASFRTTREFLDNIICHFYERCPMKPLNIRGAKQRILGNSLDLYTASNPPERIYRGLKLGTEGLRVPVITQFIVNRESRRALSEEAIKRVFEYLPSLKTVTWEPWSGTVAESQRSRELANLALLANLPATVKELTLWECWQDPTDTEHEHADASQERPAGWHASLWRGEEERTSPQFSTSQLMDVVAAEPMTGHRRMALTTAYACRNLSSFNAAGIIDATEFFQNLVFLAEAQPRLAWSNLTTIALKTPQVLRTDTREGLFRTAGDAAALVPRLQVMELWDVTANAGAVFRFRVFELEAELVLETTMGAELSDEVRQLWVKMALQQRGKQMVVRVRVLDEDAMRGSRKGFFQRLRLLDPAQMREWNTFKLYESI
ncbi:F-box domain-containing protein [Colletotrichum asianum]|uniref:F-box domain-containing protein n=1 Tax=Colletotrichum asianum TaxID=702518 RepID=A0A8H3WFI9_9PEZI|nr:F-box domain-containing protein [Colletotrichum asianum]